MLKIISTTKLELKAFPCETKKSNTIYEEMILNTSFRITKAKKRKTQSFQTIQTIQRLERRVKELTFLKTQVNILINIIIDMKGSVSMTP